ncbi:MAG: hypothetical protein HZY79_06320 [Rhodoblastus sp.]|nr:MAG: hypothetical protein HZY79_06320 [Rhodoblastus sp.]
MLSRRGFGARRAGGRALAAAAGGLGRSRGQGARGPRDATFDAAFETAAKGLKATDDPLGVDDLILLRAAKAVVARRMGAGPNGVWVRARRHGPSGAFALAHDLFAETFARRLGLDAATAAGLAAEIEAQLLAAARIAPAAIFAPSAQADRTRRRAPSRQGRRSTSSTAPAASIAASRRPMSPATTSTRATMSSSIARSRSRSGAAGARFRSGRCW